MTFYSHNSKYGSVLFAVEYQNHGVSRFILHICDFMYILDFEKPPYGTECYGTEYLSIPPPSTIMC